MTSGPLSGIRVIDLTVAAAGPYAGGILAAQGAEVIKVERLDGGDFMRRMGAISHGVSSLFACWNRGKHSICVDLKQPQGVALLKKLVAGADVIMHNLRPGTAEEMGLGYEDLKAVNPGLVYAILTGWGETGPRAGDPAYDSSVQAAAGIAATQADPSDGIPGAKGVGAKGAAKLLNEYGSLEAALEAAVKGELSGRAASSLVEQREELLMFKRIATLQRPAVEPVPDGALDVLSGAAAAEADGLASFAERLRGLA